VIANAGHAAGVLLIPNEPGSRTCPPPGRRAHLPASQPNRVRLLVHEESAPWAAGRGCLLSALHSIPREELAHTDKGRGPPVVLLRGPDMPPRLLVARHLAAERRTHSRARLAVTA
jgi:hypothetical protein